MFTTYPLPDSCPVCDGPVCDGPVFYSGKGRRPLYDRPECRRAGRTHYERERARRARAPRTELDPTVGELLRRRRARFEAVPYVAVRRAVDDWIPDASELAATYSGEAEDWTESYVVDSERGEAYLADAIPRHADPAACWLVESGHSAELASFPHAARVGRTCLSVS